MGVDAKHAYRFGFLKSDWWKNFRLEALVAHGGSCYVCGKKDIGNDVHHIHYPDQWKNTKTGHVIILCRKHHKSVHVLMDQFPNLSKAKAAKMAKSEINHFRNILWDISKFPVARLGWERWSDYRSVVGLDWKTKIKMLKVGRHGARP